MATDTPNQTMTSNINVIASIVIYNHSYQELKPTLDSLLDAPSIQKVILVDNSASDWANTFVHEKVIYLKSEGNFGFGYGHNLPSNNMQKTVTIFNL